MRGRSLSHPKLTPGPNETDPHTSQFASQVNSSLQRPWTLRTELFGLRLLWWLSCLSQPAQLLFSFLLTRNKGISLAISCNSALHSFTCNPLHLAARTRGATSKGTGSCLPCPTNLTCGLVLFLCRLWISLNWPPHASYATVFLSTQQCPGERSQ